MKRILSFILSAMMLTSGMMFTAGAAEGDTEITSLTTPPTKMWGVTEGTVNAPVAAETETNIDGVKLTPVWAGADGFTFGTAADGDTVIAYTATYTAPEGYVFAESFEAGENVTVSEDGKTLTYKLYSYVIPSDALYIDDDGRTTENYGEGNLAAPYPTLDYAMNILEGKGGGTIVIKDIVTVTTSKGTSKYSGNYTLVGYDSESTFKVSTGVEYYIPGNMTIRDLNLVMECKDKGLYANGHNLTLGDKRYSDLIVTGESRARQIFAFGYGAAYTDVNSKITINSGDFALFVGTGYGGGNITGNVSYEINGGTITSFRAGLWGMTGNKNTFTGNIDFVMNGGTINNLVGTSANPNYTLNGNLNMTINGGKVTNLTPVNKNNKDTYEVHNYVNGDVTVKINGGTFTTITNYPTATITTGGVVSTPDTVSGTAEIDILDYNGDRDALAAKITASQFDVVKSQIIYVDSTNGIAGNDGFTPETALPTMTAALAKFANGVSGKIFVCGEYDTATGFTDKSGRGEVIISGYNSGKILINSSISLSGDTIIDNIVLEQATASKSIFAFGHKLVMGENITVPKGAGGYPQLEGGGSSGQTVASTNMTINGGTYGLVHSGADYNGGTITGDAILTINGGTFTENIYSGSFVKNKAALTADTRLGKIGGKAGLYINGGTFEKNVYLGGYSYATTGSLETKITGGTFAGNIVVGPQYANGEYTYTPSAGDSTTKECVTDILGNSILEITGGTFNGVIKHSGNVVNGKAAVIMTNGTSASVTPANFDYVVKASKKGTVAYDADSDKFSIVPSNSILDIYINEALTTKTQDNIYTLSGGTDNVYNIAFGGESDIAESFIITAPVPELTPVSKIILAGGKKIWNPLVSCTASDVTWEPADSKFQYDTKYTATVVLTAMDGIEYSDDFSGLNINGNYEGNTVNCTLSEDATQITVKVTFPKTPKEELELLAESKTPVSVSFTTARSENVDETALKATTITFTNINDDTLSEVVTATENGSEGTYSGEIVSGLYNVSVKKQGYIEQVKEAVYISGTNTVALDFGALTAGDIVDNDGTTAGNGKIDIDDFIVAIRAFGDSKGGVVWNAADIDENGTPSVQDLVHIKDNFANTTADVTDYDGYFENTYYRLTVDKKLTVGYIGGSIIQGASATGTRVYEAGTPVLAGNELFIDRMQANFENHFPEAEIHSINAGVSDTGSTFALYRLGSDLMLRDEGYIPDLVFLEFCVNDTGSMGEDYLQSIYEGVIREVYSINPKADIVCVLTAMSGYEVPKKAQTAVANYYNLPIADVGKPMYDQYTISGDCKVYTDDNLHPNNAGYEYYTKICYDLLEKYIVTAAPSNPTYSTKVLPEIFAKYPLINPQVIAMNDTAKFTFGTYATNEDGTPAAHQWTTGLSKAMTRAFDASSKQMPYLASAQVGDWFEFSFEGTGFSVILKQHPNMGSFEYMVDNSGEWIEYKRSNTYVHFPAYPVNLKLPDGKHTVRIRVSGKPVGNAANSSAADYCEVGIAGILCSSAEVAE